jgi:hypothetical protein
MFVEMTVRENVFLNQKFDCIEGAEGLGVFLNQKFDCVEGSDGLGSQGRI